MQSSIEKHYLLIKIRRTIHMLWAINMIVFLCLAVLSWTWHGRPPPFIKSWLDPAIFCVLITGIILEGLRLVLNNTIIENKWKKVHAAISFKEIAAFLTASAAACIAVSVSSDWSFNLFRFALYFIVPAFVFHEIGHKAAAGVYGCDAEFKTSPLLLLISILVSFSGFSLILFGAVFFNETKRDLVGKIAFSGPFVNLILSLLFLGGCYYSDRKFQAYCFCGSITNAYIAAFNLLPVPPLDGFKVFKWSKKCWASCFALGVGVVFFLWRKL